MAGKAFYAGIFGFGAGVLIRSFLFINLYHVLFLLLIAFVLALLYRIKGKHAFVVLFIIFILGASLGTIRANSSLEKSPPHISVGEEILIEGVVDDEPSFGESGQKIVVEAKKDLKLILWTDEFPQYHYGDKVSLRGELVEPREFETETGRTFDYVSYLRKDDIYFQMFRPEIELLERAREGSAVKRALFGLRRRFVESLEKVLPPPASGLAAGITVGVDDSLGERLEDLFRRTGIVHIVVLSGFNVTIVAESIMRVFSRLPLLARSGLGVVAIILFALLTGGGPTIVRASMMAGIVILASVLGRRYDISRALALAGFIMVLVNPLILAFDPSFQLSFLATLGLIYVAPLLDPKLSFIPSTWGLRGIVSASLAAQIAVLPLLLYSIGQLSIVSPLVNLLVLPIIPLAMLMSFLAGVVGFISTTLALPFSSASYVVLEYVFKVVEWFGNPSWSAAIVPQFPWWVMVAVYALMVWGVTRVQKKKPLDK